MYDARGALHYGKFAIHDTHPSVGDLAVGSVQHSPRTWVRRASRWRRASRRTRRSCARWVSSIGCARVARERFADRAEALDRTQHHHHRLRSRSFGGALQAVWASNAVMNGGYLIPPTFLKRSEQEARAIAKKSDQVRDL